MLYRIFGDSFDYNKDGRLDSLEKRARYLAVLDEMRQIEGIEKPLCDLSLDELNYLSAKSGVDPEETGF